jgi:hypothetical protein
MKKINFVLIPFIVILLWAGLSFGAACTPTAYYTNQDTVSAQYVLKMSCAATPTATELSDAPKGYYLYAIITVPGTGDAEPTAYTVDIDDAIGRKVVDLANRSTTDVEDEMGSVTLSRFPLVTDTWTLTVGALGAGNTTDVYLIFVK